MLYLVLCTEIYWPFVLELRNKVKDMFFNTNTVTEEEHKLFMSKNYASYFVCVESVLGGMPVGFIGIVDGDFRFAVEPDYQGRGVGEFMLKNFPIPVNTVKIKVENVKTRRFFEKRGFKPKYILFEREANESV